MKIRSLKIQNYKSFRETEAIEFGHGFTVVLGKNNVGKTALLEAAQFLRFQSRPHIDENGSVSINPVSTIKYDLFLEKDELKNHCMATGQTINMPVINGDGPEIMRQLGALFEVKEFSVSFSNESGFTSNSYPSHRMFPPTDDIVFAQLQANQQLGRFTITSVRTDREDNIPGIIGGLFASSVYGFKAERMKISDGPAQENPILNPDASNLPAVLLHLFGSDYPKYERLCQHLEEIFENIRRFTVTNFGAGLEIRIWPTSGRGRAEKFSVPLRECGTGVGQVLAILAVALSGKSNIIVIDEPATFLHPGAAKKLISILKSYRNNQYIVTTHSTEIISASDPDSILLVEWDGLSSKVRQIEKLEDKSSKIILSELGISLSDVMSWEYIIWVEGKTEAYCFSQIVRRLAPERMRGLVFVSVPSVSDFGGRRVDPERMFRLHEQLAASMTGTLTAHVLFHFDRDDRSEAAIKDAERRSSNLARFLPRRSFENYMLHSGAAAALVDHFAPDAERTVEELERESELWLEQKKLVHFAPHAPTVIGLDIWLREVDAAKLLDDLVHHLSGGRLKFDKVAHNEFMIDWMFKNDEGFIQPLAAYVLDLAEAVRSKGKSG